MWIEVAYDGLSGWVNLRYIAYLGATNDRTAEILTTLGETPSAENMLELEWIVAESLSPDGVLPNLVVVAAPTGGDLDEVTYDLTGQEDDSVMGARIHVFGQPTDAGFSLDSVGVTLMCARGVDGDGHCI